MTDPPASNSSPHDDGVRTLGIDCGGTGLKGSVMDQNGQMIADPVRIPTPYPLPPEKFVRVLSGIAKKLPEFDRVTVGMPGMIRGGQVINTPHYVTERGPRTRVSPELLAQWRGLDIQAKLSGK